MSHIIAKFDDVELLRRIHGWATVFWLTMIPPTLFFWKESILWVALMSVWANVAGHWSGWSAARTEVRQKGMEE